jgi:hypothetical protein
LGTFIYAIRDDSVSVEVIGIDDSGYSKRKGEREKRKEDQEKMKNENF